MAIARVNMSATTTPALTSGEGSGGQALSDIGTQSITFARAGMNTGGVSTLERYGSDLAGQVGNLAATAKTNRDSTDALLTEATNRRSSAEGVNLDEELVNLTTFQQAYSASGRLIQAAKDMFDTLMNMV
jgi:flagellar hook-associated protein 1 FlgK